MKIFTVGNGTVEEGATVGKVTILSADVEIKAVCIGESGRGRKFSYIPISWVSDETTKVTNVKLGETRTGKPKFIAINPEEDDNTTDECVIVFKHTAGYRGSAYLTGDRVDLDSDKLFEDFPGEIILEGAIAQGAAGRMGGNSQYIAKMRKGDIFRIKRTGRLYGNPTSYYGCFDGHKVTLVTWQDREAAELWFD
jgi:hypothetical protein